MPLVKRTVTVIHADGLHARPAALFVQTAKKFMSKVTVKKGRKSVDGKSIMGLLTLVAHHGSRISIVVDGPDAITALEHLCRSVSQSVGLKKPKSVHIHK